jgi:hypothetical protein
VLHHRAGQVQVAELIKLATLQSLGVPAPSMPHRRAPAANEQRLIDE